MVLIPALQLRSLFTIVPTDTQTPVSDFMNELTALHTAWDVDRRIVLDSADKLVLIRFSSYATPPDALLFTTTATSSSGSAPLNIHGDTPLLKRVRGEERKEQDATGVSLSSSPADVDGAEHYLRTQQMDSLLRSLAPKVRKYCTIYTVDTNAVRQFNEMYELGHDRDPFAVMFFYRNQHIRVDVGTGNNNKVNFYAFEDLYDFLPIVEAAYKAGRQGQQITSSATKFSTVSLRR